MLAYGKKTTSLTSSEPQEWVKWKPTTGKDLSYHTVKKKKFLPGLLSDLLQPLPAKAWCQNPGKFEASLAVSQNSDGPQVPWLLGVYTATLGPGELQPWLESAKLLQRRSCQSINNNKDPTSFQEATNFLQASLISVRLSYYAHPLQA